MAVHLWVSHQPTHDTSPYAGTACADALISVDWLCWFYQPHTNSTLLQYILKADLLALQTVGTQLALRHNILLLEQNVSLVQKILQQKLLFSSNPFILVLDYFDGSVPTSSGKWQIKSCVWCVKNLIFKCSATICPLTYLLAKIYSFN